MQEVVERARYPFAIDVRHAARFTGISKKNRRAIEQWAREFAADSEGQVTIVEARIEARRRRAELWPTIDQYVERAVRQRLAEPDLAGPWTPLTDDEWELATLPNRGFGKNYPGILASRAFTLPIPLVRELRTAAVRVSEEPLAQMEELGLLYNSLLYDDDERERREELVKLVFSAPRIVRQALERYGPWPPEDGPPSSD
ncbi:MULTISPECIES: hypothetical protein [unclassified Streptomyces]|uniref:hypothetical protein n=1 Tax=unclassified Streptomyces TaxID=2593676 RepID=UPI0035E30ED8